MEARKRTVLLISVAPELETKLRAALQEAELISVEPKDCRHAVASLDRAVAVVQLDGGSDQTFRCVRELATGGTRVVVMGPEKDADLILRAMREGAKEYAVVGDEHAIAHAVREQLRPGATDSGSVYAVFPAKGGVGATTLACNLAGALAHRGERVCLVDLNLTMGDVLSFLDLNGGYSVSDVILNIRRLDRTLLDSSILKHTSGVRVVAQTHRIDDAERVDADSISSLVQFLRQHFDAIVLDGLRSFDEVSVAALDVSDRILLTVTQEVPAVRDARRCADLFRKLGIQDRVALILNRYQKAQIDREVAAEAVGLPVLATLSNDYPAVIRAVNKGVLLHQEVPRAQVTRDVEALVALLGRPGRNPQPVRRSRFYRFFMRPSHAAQ